MSVEIKYDQNRKVLYATLSGELDIDELVFTLENIETSDNYPSYSNSIWDIRTADASNVNFQFISAMVKITSRFEKLNYAKSALIVSSNLQYGLGRMFQMLSEGIIPMEVMVFRNFNEGEQWLLD